MTFPAALALTAMVADDDGGVEVGVSILTFFLAVMVEMLFELSKMFPWADHKHNGSCRVQ